VAGALQSAGLLEANAGAPNRQPNKPMQVHLQGIDFEKLRARIAILKADIGYSAIQKRIEELQRASTAEGFWRDGMAELNALELKLQPIEEIIRRVTLLEEEFESLNSLSGDADRVTLVAIVNNYRESYESVIKELEAAERKSLFTGEFDHSDAILTIRAESSNPGPCVFAFKLYKMYQRWIGTRGFTSQLIAYDAAAWEKNGSINFATLRVIGEYAYGYLQAESGVHRLNGVYNGLSRFSVSTIVMVRPHLLEEAAIINASTQQPRDGRGTMPGNAVRTYSENSGIVLDNKTKEKGNLASVLDGEIDSFIEARLRALTSAGSRVQVSQQGRLRL
jgi:protein subunit release factor A